MQQRERYRAAQPAGTAGNESYLLGKRPAMCLLGNHNPIYIDSGCQPAHRKGRKNAKEQTDLILQFPLRSFASLAVNQIEIQT